jgi:penicillin-binding protein 1A
MLASSAFFTLLLIVLLFILTGKIPQLPASLNNLGNTPSTAIYDSEGRIILLLGERDMVTLDRISPYFQKAIIAAEDKNFYRHHGIDKFAIVRSFIVGIFSERRIAGGSTITQQLAKNLFFTLRRDIVRKLKEALAAAQIEQTFTKDEILEAYCNQIPFGSRANGVERAARTFFGIPAADLSLAQSALLAGLPNSPSRLNPFAHPERAKQRQAHILKNMRKLGFITEEERSIAEAESIVFNPSGYTGKGTWFADRVIEGCEKKFGRDEVYYGGLKIFTTMKPDYQKQAESCVKNGLDELRLRVGSDSLQGALIAVSTQNGAILAQVGGYDYISTQYDRTTDARRRPGSGFKPFLYYTAFQNLELNPATVELDSAITIESPGAKAWSPRNSYGEYFGRVILKYAFAQSLNTVAARVVVKATPEMVVQTAKSFGITSPLKAVPSIALGSSEVTPLDMASAFSVFANGGDYYEPYNIERVESPWGETLYEKFIISRRVADPKALYLVLDMMKEVLDTGTGRSARWVGFSYPAGGKTGTSDDYFDSWFIGFTPTICTCVWVGYDQERSMLDKDRQGISGSRGALQIWAQFMKLVCQDEAPRDFPIPEGVKFERVNINTGCLADSGNVMTVALPMEVELPVQLEAPAMEILVPEGEVGD